MQIVCEAVIVWCAAEIPSMSCAVELKTKVEGPVRPRKINERRLLITANDEGHVLDTSFCSAKGVLDNDLTAD